jgi:aminoglycoside phosphotransferase (APT) family kinase protein
MIDAVREWLAGAAPAAPRAAGGIVLSLYRTSPKAVIVLVDHAGAPAALVKVARREDAEASLVAEHAALTRLQSAGDWVRSQAPVPLGLDRVGGRLVLAQSFLDGDPMTTRYYMPGHTRSRRRVARDFDKAGAWLSRFHQETSTGAAPFDDGVIARLVRAPIERYRAEIGWSSDEASLFDEVLVRAEELRGTPLPMCAGHGDFWMGNLMATRRGITGAVDWEHSSPSTTPFDDMYKFPTSYSFYLDRALPRLGRVPGHPGWTAAREHWRRTSDWANLAGFGYAFFGDGWYPNLVRSWITERASTLGMAPALHPVLFPIFLARQATTLADPIFRNGYRAAIRGLSAERRTSWLWQEGSIRPLNPPGSSTEFRRSAQVSRAGHSM